MLFSQKQPMTLANLLALAICTGPLVGIGQFAVVAATDGAGSAQVAKDTSDEPIRYDRDIRPLLSDRCFKCHGRDSKVRQADLRLDVRENATAKHGRYLPIVPNHPEQSDLWRRVNSDDPDVRMPPPDSNKRPLSPEERKLIQRWITEGAVYEPHWAFTPPIRPAVPEVHNPAWCRNPVDRFVLSRLERKGITPSEEAPREALIRRLFFDVTGLPPTLEEMDAWLKDDRPDAYEQWVDKLFTKEPYRSRYAEHMAVPWLDASRYADTCGIHTDAGRQMWLWRDWVLNAFRNNMHFDQFTTEQIAGDLIPKATDQQKIASGFNRNHVTTDEGGAIPEEYLVEYAVDRASTTGSVFLGLTVGCGRCHDHKYDPISQEEFYRFYSYFNSIEEPGLYAQSPDSNRALEPFLQITTPAQEAELRKLREKMAPLVAEINAPRFQDDQQRASFVLEKQKKAGLVWEPTKVTTAGSLYGASLAIQSDGSVLATGRNPDRDEHFITLQTNATDLRMLMLEAMPDRDEEKGRVGRAPNGNAVLTAVEAEARSILHPEQSTPVRFIWAWADAKQENGDFSGINTLDYWDDRGWAVDGIDKKIERIALLLADKPFGFEGGTEVRFRLRYNSPYPQHVLARVRLSLAKFADAGLDLLPVQAGGWYQAGPFAAESPQAAYSTAFGPEQDTAIDVNKKFGAQSWRYDAKLVDEKPNDLPTPGVNVTYVGRRVASPTNRKVDISLGSDDGFALFVNGQQVAARQIDRAVAPDQDKAQIELHAGMNTIVLKIINTGSAAGYYYRTVARADELFGDLMMAFVPESARTPDFELRLRQTWRERYSPGYREQKEQLASTKKSIEQLEAQEPRTMVMQEMPKPRETFLLVRGQYDKPDKNHPITRGIPEAIGKLPEGAPQNRLGLAKWLTSKDNPLVARVAVNRYWEMLFGVGIVRTSEDFGMQSEWPSHPDLLDWLAVEFRESGWDVQHMLRLMLTSSTYRQSSRVRPELHEEDPDNRLLAYFPRHRLGAEIVRDQALFISGLLVEKLGGPSVKPYQPDGLWKEVAMSISNTRLFNRGDGSDLWRRSLYTYWKRACPPPSLMTFDAPTRESCVIRRGSTNTPLQALVLWNDEQYVEAARTLATRTLKELKEATSGRLVSDSRSKEEILAEHDRAGITSMFRRCIGRSPDEIELKRTLAALAQFRERYRQKPDDAAKLLKEGESPVPKDIESPELAAWTMIANALLNLSATITQS